VDRRHVRLPPLPPTIRQTTKPGGAGSGACSISGGALLVVSQLAANAARMSVRLLGVLGVDCWAVRDCWA
jgi:hypothetical protein